MQACQPWRSLLRDVSGGVLTIFSFSLPVVLGATALAVDSAYFYSTHNTMQDVTDSASLAVAKEIRLHIGKLDELEAAGKVGTEALLAAKRLDGNPHTIEVSINPATNIVEIELSLVVEPYFPIDVWGDNPLVVRSQARAYGQSRLCVLGLHPNKSDTLKAGGEGVLSAPGCAVQSNSTDQNGLHVAPKSKIVSSAICTSGGYKGGSGTYEPTPETDCPALDDPLAGRAPPEVGGCDYLDTSIGNGQTTSISPGVYCGGLKIDNGAIVTAEPGIYVFTGGKLELKNGGSLTGEYVGFYFDDDAALFSFDFGTTIDLTAPKDGPMAGILFYESRAAAEGRRFEIKTAGAKRLLGTIYLPNGILTVDAKGNIASESAYTVIVARQIDLKDANLVVNSDYGGTDVPVPEGLGPTSSMVTLSK